VGNEAGELRVSSYQQGVMIEEDQRSILIIGGIEIFLPSNPVEARDCVAGETTEEKSNSDCQIGGGNGEDIGIFPSRIRRALRGMAQNFQPGS
jgi:hypothetical protein